MSKVLIDSVKQLAINRCEYCRIPQRAHVLTFPIDHVIAKQHGGRTVLGNLALSCTRCNSCNGPNIAGLDPLTGELTRLFHPRSDCWLEHFRYAGPIVEGLSAIGRTTISVLQMNNSDSVALRTALILEDAFIDD